MKKITTLLLITTTLFCFIGKVNAQCSGGSLTANGSSVTGGSISVCSGQQTNLCIGGASATSGGTLEYRYYICYAGGTGVTGPWGPSNSCYTFYPTSSNTQGKSYSLQVREVDGSGNQIGSYCSPGHITVNVTPAPNDPAITGPTLGSTGVSYTFSTPAQSGVTFSWDDNGGSGSSTSNSLTTSWSTPGSKSVCVTASTSGCQETECHTISLTQPSTCTGTPPSASISGPTTGNKNTSYTFSTPAISGITYSWTATDGTTSSGSGTSIATSWTTDGIYKITVTASKSGCSDVVDEHYINIGNVSPCSVSVSGEGPVCSGGSRILTATSSTATTSGRHIWESSPNGSSSWTYNTSSMTNTLNTGSISSSTFYRVTTYSSITTGTGKGATTTKCQATSDPVEVKVLTTGPTASITGGGRICTGGTDTLVAISNLPSTDLNYQWRSSNSASAATSNIAGATDATYIASGLTANKFYQVVVSVTGSSSNCSQKTANKVSVLVYSPLTANSTGGGDICPSGIKTLSANSVGGDASYARTYQWQKTEDLSTGFWENTGINSSTYTTEPLTTTTYYRFVVEQDGRSACGPVTSNTQTVTVVPAPTATISGNGTICNGGADALAVSSSGGTGTKSYQWQISTNGSTGWVNTASNSHTINTGTLTSDRWYRAIITQSGSGCEVTSPVVKVTVVNDPTASISGSQTICTGGTALFNVSSTGGTGTKSYQW